MKHCIPRQYGYPKWIPLRHRWTLQLIAASNIAGQENQVLVLTVYMESNEDSEKNLDLPNLFQNEQYKSQSEFK